MEGREQEADTSLRGGGWARVCRHNGLINTRGMEAEPHEDWQTIYSAPQYQGHVVANTVVPAPPQLLNPSALLQHQTAAVADSYLRPTPGLLLSPETVLRAWGDTGGGECCETTFIEGLCPDPALSCSTTKELLYFADGRSLDCYEEDARIHTVSYDIDDEDEFHEIEVKNDRLMDTSSEDAGTA